MVLPARRPRTCSCARSTASDWRDTVARRARRRVRDRHQALERALLRRRRARLLRRAALAQTGAFLGGDACPGSSSSRSGSSAGSASCPRSPRTAATTAASPRPASTSRSARSTSPFSRYVDLELGPPAPEHRRRPRVLLGRAPARVHRRSPGFARDRPALAGRRRCSSSAWFATFFVIKGTADEASIEDASFFRLLMPAFPAFLLLLACIPLLVPTFGLTQRLFTPAPATPPPRRATGRSAPPSRVSSSCRSILVAGTRRRARRSRSTTRRRTCTSRSEDVRPARPRQPASAWS